jgi:hypothetical protein
MSTSNTVSKQDLSDLLVVLYQGSMRKNPLSVKSFTTNIARFFKEEDIPAVAETYNLPLSPTSNLQATLDAGVRQGLFLKSVQDGTQCGNNFPCGPTTKLPTLVYAYNPNLAKIPSNRAFLSPFASYNQQIQGSAVLFQNNRAPCYGTRGEATLSRGPFISTTRTKSSACCSK